MTIDEKDSPGSVQGQAGWGFEQPGVVEGVPAHGGRVELDYIPYNTNHSMIPWF